MTPLVQTAVEQQFRATMPAFQESPEDYTWFDVDTATQADRRALTPSELQEVMVLPFAKTAFVTRDDQGVPIIVYARQKAVGGTVITAVSASISVPKRKRLLLCEMTLGAPDGALAAPLTIEAADAGYPGLDIGKEAADHIAELVWLVLRAYYSEANPLTGSTYVGAASNKRRAKEGKCLLFEWRTVVIAPKALPNPPKGGTHASPRHHDRRGHWSVSKLGKRYWRRPTKVGNPANGVVFHDYQLKTKEQP